MSAPVRRVVLVEDHATLREGLALLLQAEGFEVAGQAGEAAGAYDLVGREKPDAVVVDLKLPGENGIELTRRLLRRDGRLGVLLLTGAEEAPLLADALESGARGVAHKAAPLKETVRAVRAVAAGGSYVDPHVQELINEQAPQLTQRTLSVREREVLELVAAGCDRREIAERLSISEETVRTHVRNAMGKLGAHSRANAVMIALRRGEIRD
jgi:DNA-binding NarL/FixJ family response regulator